MPPRREGNVRPDLWRSIPVLSKPAGAPATLGRRAFLGLGAALTGSLAFGAKQGHAEPEQASPPADPPWSQSLGAGVVDRPYGRPADSEAGVIRRNVPWLTADAEIVGQLFAAAGSARHHYAERPVLRALSCRPADIDPDQHRLMIHGLVERPLILTMNDIVRFPPVSRIHFIECPANGGMEWRAAQLNSLQFTHGMIGCAEWTGVKLSTLLEEVGLKKEAKWVMVEGADAAHMNRSLPLDKCLDDCLVVYAPERRGAAPRTGLSAAAFGPRLGRQCQHQMAAPDQARRQAVVFPRGDFEIYRPDAGRNLARLHLAHRRQIGHHLPLPRKAARSRRGSTKSAAWPGPAHGKIKRVDVSTDGGVNWQSAQLHEPVLSKALTQVHVAVALGRQAGAAAVAGDRRDRLCAADHRAIAQSSAASIRSITTIRSRPGR